MPKQREALENHLLKDPTQMDIFKLYDVDDFTKDRDNIMELFEFDE